MNPHALVLFFQFVMAQVLFRDEELHTLAAKLLDREESGKNQDGRSLEVDQYITPNVACD